MAEHWTATLKRELEEAKETIKGLQDELAAAREGTRETPEGGVALYVEALRPFANRSVLEFARRMEGRNAVDMGVRVEDLKRAVELVEECDRKK